MPSNFEYLITQKEYALFATACTEDDGSRPDFIPSPKINTFVFNEKTVDTVIQDLMTNDIHVAGGDRIGKTIIFAQNKQHAEFILKRFNHLYPHLKGGFVKRITCEDSYAQSIIDDFKIAEKEPYIVVSVDMMDTGIDFPECVNLVLFKKVRSKTKFWQMIGRGTGLCPGLDCTDLIDGSYTGKRRFFIFDYLGNFEFFRAYKEGIESRETGSLSEVIFAKRVAADPSSAGQRFHLSERAGSGCPAGLHGRHRRAGQAF